MLGSLLFGMAFCSSDFNCVSSVVLSLNMGVILFLLMLEASNELLKEFEN